MSREASALVSGCAYSTRVPSRATQPCTGHSASRKTTHMVGRTSAGSAEDPCPRRCQCMLCSPTKKYIRRMKVPGVHTSAHGTHKYEASFLVVLTRNNASIRGNAHERTRPGRRTRNPMLALTALGLISRCPPTRASERYAYDLPSTPIRDLRSTHKSNLAKAHNYASRPDPARARLGLIA